MSDNLNTSGVGLSTITQLIQLLATYGVYVLVIIFMFYQQRRARLSLSECKEKDRPYYQRQNTIVLWTTIGFSVLAAAVWVFTAFVYQPRLCIEGTIKDLTEQTKRPIKEGDPPMVIHRIAAFRGDVNFYSSEKPTLKGDSVDLGWAIVSPSGSQLLQLVFQKQYYMLSPKSPNEALTVSSGQEDLAPRVIEGYPTKMASLDLKGHKSLLGQQIQVIYKPDAADPIRNIGSLWVVDGDVFFPIPWVENSAMESSPKAKSTTQAALFGTGVAWAETPRQQLFGEKGEIQPEVAQRIREYLESDELARQLVAQASLVENGPRSFPFIVQMLQDKSGETRNRGLLVHNLACVVDQIEKTRSRAPSNLNLLLGEALYAAGDAKLAATYFGKIPESQPLPAKTLLASSLAMLDANRIDEARRGFQKYYEMVDNPREKSNALTDLGVSFSRRGEYKQAREYFQKAIDLNPKNLTAQFNLGLAERWLNNPDGAVGAFEKVAQLNPKDPKAKIQIADVRKSQGNFKESAKILEEVVQSNQDPGALNNLAFVYALQGVKLDKALGYVEQAIKLGGESADNLDTKGWVLYKMGDHAQGLDYLRRAVAKAPANQEIRGHLEEAQGRLAAKKK